MNFIDELAIWLHWQLLIISFLSPILKSLHYNDSDGVLILHRYYRVTDISGFSFLYNLPLELPVLLASVWVRKFINSNNDRFFLSVILFICLILNRITLFAYFQWHIGVILWRLLVFLFNSWNCRRGPFQWEHPASLPVWTVWVNLYSVFLPIINKLALCG